MSRAFHGRNLSSAEGLHDLVKGSPICAFFYALGGFTFLKFVIKTFVVFGETFILPGTDVSVTPKLFKAVAHSCNFQLTKFGAGKGSWAGRDV